MEASRFDYKKGTCMLTNTYANTDPIQMRIRIEIQIQLYSYQANKKWCFWVPAGGDPVHHIFLPHDRLKTIASNSKICIVFSKLIKLVKLITCCFFSLMMCSLLHTLMATSFNEFLSLARYTVENAPSPMTLPQRYICIRIYIWICICTCQRGSLFPLSSSALRPPPQT